MQSEWILGGAEPSAMEHEVVQTAWESKISCQDILSVRWDVIQALPFFL